MIIDNCNFPDNLLYDPDNFVWVDVSNENSIKIGIIPILSSIAGKLQSIKLKKKGTNIEKGKARVSGKFKIFWNSEIST